MTKHPSQRLWQCPNCDEKWINSSAERGTADGIKCINCVDYERDYRGVDI